MFQQGLPGERERERDHGARFADREAKDFEISIQTSSGEERIQIDIPRITA